jgi:AAA+ ATPase superfamily predicted ATPase
MFIGRDKELQLLEQQSESNRFELPVVYGRRRVGKSTLIKKFIEKKKHIYFTATLNSAQDNLENLSFLINEHFEEGAGGVFPTFESAFEAVERIAKNSEEGLIFVIDEYPYLAESVKGISSVLQKVIDDKYLGLKNMMVILSGSSMSFMKEQVLGYESPLYGRRTSQINLKPFSFFEARKMLPEMASEDFVTVYGITGGIPLYLTMMDEQKSLKENLLANFFTENTFLFEEPSNLLKQELRTPARYNAIIGAIAGGVNKANEIAMRTNLSTDVLTQYLNSLIELGIVGKNLPLGSTNKKQTLYKVVDGLFSFWYRFVPKNLMLIENGNIDLVWQRVEKDLTAFSGKVFEDICIQWLKVKNGSGYLPFDFAQIGGWWGNNPTVKVKQAEEIDILAFGLEEDQIIVGECKWTSKLVDVSVLNKLIERSEFFPQVRKQLILFAKKGFTAECKKEAELKGVKLLAFNDLVV